MRNSPVFEEPDHRGHSQRKPCRMKKMTILFLGHGYPLQHQHNRTPGRAHINRLIRRIQHQHRGMQRLRITLLMHTNTEDRRRNRMPAVITRRIVPVDRHIHDDFAKLLTDQGSIPKLSLSFSFNVRATVATQTFSAPAFNKIRAHSFAVVPVVRTSSTSSTPRPATLFRCLTRNAPRIFSALWCRVRPICEAVGLIRSSASTAIPGFGNALRFKAARIIKSD